MADERFHPEIIECEIRLHDSRPPQKESGEPWWADWARTTVGEPVIFKAIAIVGKGKWNGPLPPGVEIPASRALDDPYWTVFLPSPTGVPIMSGRVGHPLAVGEVFALAPGVPGTWIRDVVFDGAIVIG